MGKPKHKKSDYKKVAQKHGVTANEVESEISAAIKFAFNAPDGSAEKQLFAELFPDGNLPTNAEFIEKMAARVLGELGKNGGEFK